MSHRIASLRPSPIHIPLPTTDIPLPFGEVTVIVITLLQRMSFLDDIRSGLGRVCEEVWSLARELGAGERGGRGYVSERRVYVALWALHMLEHGGVFFDQPLKASFDTMIRWGEARSVERSAFLRRTPCAHPWLEEATVSCAYFDGVTPRLRRVEESVSHA